MPSTTLADTHTYTGTQKSGPSTQVDADADASPSADDFDLEKGGSSPRSDSASDATYDPFLFREGRTGEDELVRLRKGSRGAKRIAQYQLRQNTVRAPRARASHVSH